MGLTIRVLGAAAGGGFPQWNANSEACRRARAGDAAARPATQASIAVSADRARWALVNASPDLRAQIEATPALHPRDGLRSSPIAAVVLTNGDVDAIAGLLSLREGTPFALYAHEKVLAILDRNPVFEVLDRRLVPRRALGASAAWQPLAAADGAALGIEIRAFPAPGKAPLYMEGEAPDTQVTTGDTIGLEIRAGGPGSEEAGFVYLANCAAMTAEVARRLRGRRLVFFDGTLYRDDEMVAQGAGAKTGRRMGHMSMAGPDGSMAALSPLGIGRTIFIHVNNTNPALLADAPERRAVEAAGFEIAYDGMEVTL